MKWYIPIFFFFAVIVLIGTCYYGTVKDETKKDTKKESFSQSLVLESPKIPKNIIQVWKTWSAKSYTQFAKNTDALKQMNSDYNYIFFKDKDIDDFLKMHYPYYYKTYQELPLNIQKMDFFRYVALYHFGGFYFDMDIHSLQPLSDDLLYHDVVVPVDEPITSANRDQYRFREFARNGIKQILGQYAFGCAPKHPFIKRLIDGIVENLSNIQRQAKFYAKSHDFVYQTTGPDYVTTIYMNYPDKEDIYILEGERQKFGKYAKHSCVGGWK